MIKAEFSASLLQSSVSHDPSEIILICWFAAQETFLIVIGVENSCAASYFCEYRDTFLFQQKLVLLFIKDVLNESKVTFIMLQKISIVSSKKVFNIDNKNHYQ